MMATIKLLILALVALQATGFPQNLTSLQGPTTRNTIFYDERLEGQIFEDADLFKDVELLNDTPSPYRLPTTTIPLHYNVFWNINIQNFLYSGTVDIDLVATEENVNEIVIHSAHHTIDSYTLQLGNTPIPVSLTTQPEYTFARFELDSGTLEYNAESPIIYRLTITFSASMRTDMYGIYRSWYRNTPSEGISWMATTQFQSTASRYAFPCYDEPKFKATFDITIRRPSTYRSWSAMRIQTTNLNVVEGFDDDIYFTTPVMSTYLIAIIVADYGTISVSNNENQLTHEVIARRGAIITDTQGDYALDLGQKLLAEMSSHTGIDFYSVNVNLKMTQAAIPDFSAGAMENWGLLTYREAYLLYSEENTSGYFQQLIAYILSHEIAHMWFGNLVTCDWWDVTWLNEGFARYYQYYLTAWVDPEMGHDIRFITEQVHTALLSDSGDNPHPLTNPGVGSPAEVSSMFSTITYNKGACIIRMTEHLLGFDNHRQALRTYLNTMRFQAVVPMDLFTVLQEVAEETGAISEYPNFSVIDYYKSWTEQSGVPVLFVEVDHNTGDMHITQRRFNINRGYSSVDTNWIIPVTFSTASDPDFDNTKPTHIIHNTFTIINKGSNATEWVLFNKQQTGYYRVNYDDHTWSLIVNALKGADRTKIHEYNRAQIVNDVFQFARSGLMTYSKAFTILSFLENETEYTPWVAAMTGFSWLRARLAGTAYLQGLEEMISKWATRVMNRITYYPIPDESFMQRYLRYQLAPVMCSMNVRPCRIAAVAQFRALVNNQIEVPVDNRLFVYCNALREGTLEDFNVLWNRFRTHNVYTEKITLLQTLGCSPLEDAINTFMDGIVKDEYTIRPQDYTTAINSATSGNEVNTMIVFQYIQDNYDEVLEAFGSITMPLSYVTSRLRTYEQIAEFQAWAWENQEKLGTAYRTLFNQAESARSSIEFAESVAEDIMNYVVSGDQDLNPSTNAPSQEENLPITTSPRPEINEPIAPELPSSAFSASVSMSVLILGLLAAVRL